MLYKNKILLIGIGVVFAAIFLIWYQFSGSSDLLVDVSASREVSVGVPFDLAVNLTNKSGDTLSSVRLFLNLPDGIVFVGSPITKNADFKELKNLVAGSLGQQAFKLMAISGENASKTIEAQVTYLSGSLSSRFEAKKNFEIAIGPPGLLLELKIPEKVISGEEFETEVFYKNVSDSDFSDLKLKIEYPPAYVVKKSSLNPDVGNNIWVLGGLRPGSEMKFTINGVVLGPDNSIFDLKAVIESSFWGQSYPISAQIVPITLAASPLSLTISVNDDPEYIVRAGEDLNYTLKYSNNTGADLRDVAIRAQLIGSMFDTNYVNVQNGSFQISDNTASWQFPVVGQGDSGSVILRVRVKSDYPIRRLSDKNFTVKISGRIDALNHMASLTTLENKVSGRVRVEARGFFRDADSGILNNGPMPPKINQLTNFTIHWLITNYSTDLQNVEARAKLANNVKFTGISQSNTDSIPFYDSDTNEMVWNLKTIAATIGTTGKPLEAIFQVEAGPASKDAGKYMQLIHNTLVRANEEFTGLELAGEDDGITTALPDDSTVGGQGVVVQ